LLRCMSLLLAHSYRIDFVNFLVRYRIEADIFLA